MKALMNKLVNLNVSADYLAKWRFYKHIYNSRKALNKLSNQMLEDIGITKLEAQNEAKKPFWRTKRSP